MSIFSGFLNAADPGVVSSALFGTVYVEYLCYNHHLILQALELMKKGATTTPDALFESFVQPLRPHDGSESGCSDLASGFNPQVAIDIDVIDVATRVAMVRRP